MSLFRVAVVHVIASNEQAGSTWLLHKDMPKLMLGMLVRCLSLLLMATCVSSSRIWGAKSFRSLLAVRGGADTTQDQPKELTLDEKVNAAMKKLGLTPPSEESLSADDASCAGGVCPMPDATTSAPAPAPAQEDASEIAARIAKDLHVDVALAMAAIGATAKMEGDSERRFDEQAARRMIQQELEFVGKVSADEDEVSDSCFNAMRMQKRIMIALMPDMI